MTSANGLYKRGEETNEESLVAWEEKVVVFFRCEKISSSVMVHKTQTSSSSLYYRIGVRNGLDCMALP